MAWATCEQLLHFQSLQDLTLGINVSHDEWTLLGALQCLRNLSVLRVVAQAPLCSHSLQELHAAELSVEGLEFLVASDFPALQRVSAGRLVAWLEGGEAHARALAGRLRGIDAQRLRSFPLDVSQGELSSISPYASTRAPFVLTALAPPAGTYCAASVQTLLPVSPPHSAPGPAPSPETLPGFAALFSNVCRLNLLGEWFQDPALQAVIQAPHVFAQLSRAVFYYLPKMPPPDAPHHCISAAFQAQGVDCKIAEVDPQSIPRLMV